MVRDSVVKHTLDLMEGIAVVCGGCRAVLQRRAMAACTYAAIGHHQCLARQNTPDLAEDRVGSRAELQLKKFGARLRPQRAGRQSDGEQSLRFGGEAEAFSSLDIIEGLDAEGITGKYEMA